MTAPFTTDPGAIEARRLRSLPGLVHLPYAWKVGCGYAVHDGFGTQELLVVRLSDGWSWRIPNGAQRSLRVPYGVTCDEVFAGGDVGEHWTIGRVRIDSLGPGMPPD
jgi:hypothetical protein